MMCKLIRFLADGLSVLCVVTFLELIYTVCFVARNYEDFTTFNLVITVILNVAMIFFGVMTIIGAAQLNKELLIVCLVFFCLEYIRCLVIMFQTWDINLEMYEKIFTIFDTGKELFLI